MRGFSVCQAFTSDGEEAQPLCARFAKQEGFLPNLRAYVRCRVHGRVRPLENVLQTDCRLKKLVEPLILQYSTGPGQPGGSRASHQEQRKRTFQLDVLVFLGSLEFPTQLFYSRLYYNTILFFGIRYYTLVYFPLYNNTELYASL